MKTDYPVTFCKAPGMICPDRMLVTLPYYQKNTITNAAGVGASHVYRGNSVRDPDLTGVGLSANGFGEWAQLYQYYRVHASRAVVLARIDGATNVFADVALSAHTGTGVISVATGLENLAASTFGKAKNINVYQQANFNTSVMSTSVLGYPRNAIDINDNLAANISTDPVSTWTWQLSVFSTPGVTLDYSISIFYDVEFFGRVNVTAI